MIADFLKTEILSEDLLTTLRVLREFKSCESDEEYIMTMFDAWTKLEQLEEYLAYLVKGSELKQDTLNHIGVKGLAEVARNKREPI